MEIKVADIVVSLNGRDAGKHFVVASISENYAMLVNGVGRRLEKPKRKKYKHVRPVGKTDEKLGSKLRSGEKVTNSEIRKALAVRSEGEEGGM